MPQYLRTLKNATREQHPASMSWLPHEAFGHTDVMQTMELESFATAGAGGHHIGNIQSSSVKQSHLTCDFSAKSLIWTTALDPPAALCPQTRLSLLHESPLDMTSYYHHTKTKQGTYNHSFY